MRDYKIRRFRSGIIKWGLIFFTSVAFIYSNILMFIVMSEQGVEVPKILIYVFQSWPYWMIAIGLTYIFAIFNYLYEEYKEKQRR